VVEARLRADQTAHDLLAAMFRAERDRRPKVRAMEVIAALEPVRRGLYTGAFGWLGHDGSLELAMAIRVLTTKRARRTTLLAAASWPTAIQRRSWRKRAGRHPARGPRMMLGNLAWVWF